MVYTVYIICGLQYFKKKFFVFMIKNVKQNNLYNKSNYDDSCRY